MAPVNFPALSSHRMVPSHVIASSFNLGNVVGFEVELGVSLHMLSQLHSILVIVVMLKNNLVLLTQLMKSMKKSIEELSKRPLALRQKRILESQSFLGSVNPGLWRDLGRHQGRRRPFPRKGARDNF